MIKKSGVVMSTHPKARPEGIKFFHFQQIIGIGLGFNETPLQQISDKITVLFDAVRSHLQKGMCFTLCQDNTHISSKYFRTRPNLCQLCYLSRSHDIQMDHPKPVT